MGMALYPINPADEAPKDEEGKAEVLRYCWGDWEELNNLLDSLGVDTSEFRYENNGEFISYRVCEEVADALENNPDKLKEIGYESFADDIPFWRTCGGYRQC